MAKIKKSLLLATGVLFVSGQAFCDSSVKLEKPNAVISTKISKKSDSKFDLSIRYVDSFSVIRESEEGKLVSKELEQKRMILGKEIQVLEQTFSAAAKELQAKASTLSASGREREQKRMVKMEREYKAKLQESDEDMKITMQSAQERLLHEHNDAAYKYARANDIDLIFGPGGVVFASEKANCTLGIIEGMNKNYEVKVAKAKGKAPSAVVASNKKTARTT